EVARTKRLRPMTFDNLKEQSRTVLHRFGKDLQQVAFFIPVHQDTELLQCSNFFINLSYTLRKHLVVSIWRRTQEFHTPLFELVYRFDNILGRYCDMRYPFFFIECQVLFDLIFFLSFVSFINSEFEVPVPV